MIYLFYQIRVKGLPISHMLFSKIKINKYYFFKHIKFNKKLNIIFFIFLNNMSECEIRKSNYDIPLHILDGTNIKKGIKIKKCF